MNEKSCILIQISRFFPTCLIDDKSALVQVIACHLFGAKPLPEPMFTKLTDIYVSLGVMS